ncbi:ATP-binding protein [uncultured Desulfobacter sp.]|uniref:ATP-binding protein n=1 Tax=uncultured Desulfobacter sp. TaxID=240139 RepID=UPI002AAAD2AD|nr:ATP-binding protein [uncultured Desulfobacter sp.]
MKTYTRILLPTLPLVFFFLGASIAVTYHFSRSALLDLGDVWLSTRLDQAMDVIREQEKNVRDYSLKNDPARVAKAKQNAYTRIRNITIGNNGFIFIMNPSGTIIFHPDKNLHDTGMGHEKWFSSLADQGGRTIINLSGEQLLVRFGYFTPWEWYVLAAAPMDEVYGAINRVQPYLYVLFISAAIILSMVLFFSTMRLIRPLKVLLSGTQAFGKGNLDTRIDIQSDDEFGLLAKEFNRMAFRLQDSLAALKQNEEHFRALIENANDMICILDREGVFRYVSPSTFRILGYPPKALLGCRAQDFIHPLEKEDATERFNLRVASLIQAHPTTVRFRHAANYWCIIECISKNLMDHPTIKGMVVNLRDITARKQAEQALKLSHQELESRVKERTMDLQAANQALNNEIQIRRQKEKELEQASRAKNEFLANVSHEIRTPLNAILGFSELLETMISEEQQISYLSAINTAAKNLSGLINDILDLSKMEAGKLEINRGPVLLQSLFDEIHHMFKVELDVKNLNFLIELPENGKGALNLDEMRLRQVITNLVGNALKFTESGTITLGAEMRTSQENAEKYVDLMIKVADTGIGICETQQDKIFEAFEQASAGTSRKFGGTGLGLAICKQLIVLMGGKLSVSSRPDQGSVFTIFLPGVERYHTAIPAPAIASKSALAGMQFAKDRVLIVDDHRDIRFMLREFLEKVNLEVIEAASGLQAIEYASAQKPVLIFLDLKMPDINGMETAARLKADQDVAQIPICLMTAGMTMWPKDELESRGFACSIAKPIAIDSLMAVLKQFISMACDTTDSTGRSSALSLLDILDRDGLPSDFLDILPRDITPYIPQTREAIKISDIQRFAERITEQGNAFGIEGFKIFGTELLQLSKAFDITKIQIYIERFIKTIDRIDKPF